MSTGMWVALWVVLVLAAAGAYVLIGIHLYHKVRAALAQAQHSTELFAQFDEALARAHHPPYQPAAAVVAPAQDREQWRRQRRANLMRRAERKRRRRATTYQRWQRTATTPHQALNPHQGLDLG